MQKQIELGERNIEYLLKVSNRARNVRLTIRPDGDFIVTTPVYANQNAVERFIFQKSKWVLEKIDYFKSLMEKNPGLFQKIKNKNGKKIKNSKKNRRAEYLKYKNQAQLLAEQKVAEFNKQYNFKFNRISIKNQKTRWGSCSKKGNLNFNYKIALLPEKLADYIIIHEICHLGQFNHSRNFWNLVAKAAPDYRESCRELRKTALLL